MGEEEGDRRTEPLLGKLSQSSYNSSEQRLVQRTGKSSEYLIHHISCFAPNS
jgi:hypothetical protein